MNLYGTEYEPLYNGLEYPTPFTELVRCTNCKRFGNVEVGVFECPDCESMGTLIDIEPHEIRD